VREGNKRGDETRRRGAASQRGSNNEWGAPNRNLPVKGSRLSIRERICYSCGSFRGLKAKLTAEERLKQIVDTELNCKTIRSRQIQGQEQSVGHRLWLFDNCTRKRRRYRASENGGQAGEENRTKHRQREFLLLSSSEIIGMRQQICDASSPLYNKQVKSSKEATRSSFLFLFFLLKMRSDILVVATVVVL
jgi:hypothetical protein